MAARIAIDPNVRVRGNETYAGLEDVQGEVVIGSHVEVYEPETGLTGPGEVTAIDHERQLVYVAVDWGQLRERPIRRLPPLKRVRRLLLAAEAFWRRLKEPSHQRAA